MSRVGTLPHSTAVPLREQVYVVSLLGVTGARDEEKAAAKALRLAE
jgi:hypothetical protein